MTGLDTEDNSSSDQSKISGYVAVLSSSGFAIWCGIMLAIDARIEWLDEYWRAMVWLGVLLGAMSGTACTAIYLSNGGAPNKKSSILVMAFMLLALVGLQAWVWGVSNMEDAGYLSNIQPTGLLLLVVFVAMLVILGIVRIMRGPTGVEKFIALMDGFFTPLKIMKIAVIILASIVFVVSTLSALLEPEGVQTSHYMVATLSAGVLITGIFTKIAMLFSRSELRSLLTEKDPNDKKKRINKLDKISNQFKGFAETQTEIVKTLKEMRKEMKKEMKEMNKTLKRIDITLKNNDKEPNNTGSKKDSSNASSDDH